FDNRYLVDVGHTHHDHGVILSTHNVDGAHSRRHITLHTPVRVPVRALHTHHRAPIYLRQHLLRRQQTVLRRVEPVPSAVRGFLPRRCRRRTTRRRFRRTRIG